MEYTYFGFNKKKYDEELLRRPKMSVILYIAFCIVSLAYTLSMLIMAMLLSRSNGLAPLWILETSWYSEEC